MPSISAEQLNKQLDTSMWPHFLRTEIIDDGLLLSLKVPEDLSYFSGHFPDQAVLPGVVQVHWAGVLAKRIFGVRDFAELKGAKFNSMILPEQEVELRLLLNSDKRLVKYSYQRGSEKFSSGSLLFRTGGAL